MRHDFRLTFDWHASRIAFGPATLAPQGKSDGHIVAAGAPVGGGSPRRNMAVPPLRPVTDDKADRDKIDRDDKERAKAVEMAVGQIEKQFGKGSIMRLGGKDAVAPIPAISTGSISLDWALGVGGLPRGRVVEIFGPESSGKTTLALQTIAQAQKLGGVAAFIDAEHALDAQYSQKLGVDLENLLVSQPDNGEQALEIAEVLIRSNGVDVLVVDSVAALVPKAEIEGDMGDPSMGLQARLMSQALRKLTGVVAKSKTCLIFINQLREKIGVMFGNPETTTGGRALKFYSSVRIDIRRIGAIEDGDRKSTRLNSSHVSESRMPSSA